MAAFFLACLIYLLVGARAAPITLLQTQIAGANGNTTQLNSELAAPWTTSSNVRGTGSLLWTCTLTLSICVYTVIHINVPPPNETAFGFFLHKTKWVLFAIFAPELGLAAAYQQWDVARNLKRQLNDLPSKQNVKGNSDTEKRKFSITYCFYAAMGGFAVDVRHIHDYRTQLTIEPQGILFLARRGHFITVPEESIKDKSKADMLAKVIICIQVLWMVIQCIGRKAAGYPIALLELHVLVHVICALCMYAFWIKVMLSLHRIMSILTVCRNRLIFDSQHS
jgi:hypothetical protein